MLVNIRDVVVSVLVFIVFMLGVFFIFTKAMTIPDFDRARFAQMSQEFSSCDTNYVTKHEQANEISSNEFIYFTDDAVEKLFYNYDFKTTCNVNYVRSSDEEIRTYAGVALKYGSDILGDPNAKMIDAVYSAPSSYYAFSGTPQEYLFFVMDSSQKQMVAITVSPSLTGELVVNSVWPIGDAGDNQLVNDYTKRLLVKYNQKINIK